MIVQDFKERLAAVIPSDKNIIVEAGAGTGKTTLLAARLCYQILGKGLKLEQIVALTFTEKAAAEIKLRLMDMMREILADLALKEPKLEITKNLTSGQYFSKTKEDIIKTIEESFETIERAQICTIHSFALQLLRLYPLEAGLSPDVQVDSGFISDYIFNKNWSLFLEEELVLSNPRRALWEELLTQFSLEELKNFALILNKPYFEYCRFESTSEEIQTFLFMQIAQAKDLLAFKDIGKERNIEKYLKEAIKRLEVLSQNLATLKESELLNLPKQEEIAKATSVKDWTKEELAQANNFIILANTLTPANLALLKKAYNFFSSFITKVKTEMRKQNVVSYDKLILLARDLVQNNLAVRQELKKRYKSLMIDEFQDTDVAQGQLLLFLAEDQPYSAKHWQDIVLEQGKLFVVGDPKQSIYRFRGANISAYQKFLELMQKQNARPCFLTTNFRSNGKIIDFVNKWGSWAIKAQNLIQAPYIPLQTGVKTEGEKPQFLQIISCPEDCKVENLRANEAQLIAAWIKDNIGKIKLGEGKTLSYKDITILYSAGTAVNLYTQALGRFNIPYNLEASGNFYEAQEIIDLINILKVIYDPQDKLALIGVLRSPLCAMKDEELIDLWQQKALNIFAKDFKASKAVKDLYNLLGTLHKKSGHINLKELICELFYKTDFMVLETLASTSEQALANILKFERFVFEKTDEGFTLGQLLLYIQTYGKQDKDESQTPLAEENFDVVNIMSIHKSKGLQAPVIILIDTWRKEINIPEKFYIDTLDSKIGISLGPLKNLNYFILHEKELLHKKAQNERLLYVALTRAEQKLLIGASAQKTQGIIEDSLRKASCYPAEEILDTDLFSTLKFEYKDPQIFLLQKSQEQVLKYNLDFGQALEAWQKRKAEFASYKEQETLAPSHLQKESLEATFALNKGSLIHKALNLYFNTGNFNLPLAFTLLDLKDKTLLEPCQELLNIFSKGKILKELKTYQFLGSEIPFSMYQNGILVNGVIDALFRDGKGKLFIVDFKTDKIDSKEIKTYSLTYESQLVLYRQAVQKLFKEKEVRCALAYLSIDELFEI